MINYYSPIIETTVEMDIYSLKDFLEERNNLQSPNTYTIMEYCPRDDEDPFEYTSAIYEIVNLRIDCIEDSIVMCNGYLPNEDAMLSSTTDLNNGNYILPMFTIGDGIVISKTENVITVSLTYCYIKIIY